MIKVFWLIRRAPEVSVDEFERWWLEKHGPDVVEWQGAQLKKYVLRFPTPKDSADYVETLDSGWDGVAEQWFESVEDFELAQSHVPVSELADIQRYFGETRGFVFREFELISNA